MDEELLKFLSVFLLTMLKFIAGPVGGYVAGFSLIETIIVSVTGMMTSVILFTFLGTFLRERVFGRFFKNRKTFTKRNRKFVAIWKKYGQVGVALLTPILLTPIVGTLLLTSFRTPKSIIIIYMAVSAIVWAIIISSALYLVGEKVIKLVG